MNGTATYPQYRKYKNDKVYFKVISSSEWEELHVSKDTVTIHHFQAKILPDRNYIADMMFAYREHWDAIEEGDYEAIKKNVKSLKDF
ncbi:MAG TPA: hypothetical protein VFF27_03920 [Bacteroidia bacterium]|jgi:hypothetical protein|nr:hypothetical protein [Bacteroidia bacterium]